MTIRSPATHSSTRWSVTAAWANGSGGFRPTSSCTRTGGWWGRTPAYVKLHSQGEFVFDWSWAEAYARHGLEYYPKLVSAIPFTPFDRTEAARPPRRRRAVGTARARRRRGGGFEGDAGVIVSLAVPP